MRRTTPAPSPRSGDAFGLSRADLLGHGWTPRGITSAVSSGTLIRARNGCYLAADTDADLVLAVSLGGRLTCLGALVRWGVFVLDTPSNSHIHVPQHATRVRRPPRTVHRHWDRLLREPHPLACQVEPIDAIAHALRCQPPRASVATLDSALRLGLMRRDELGELFARLPRRFRVLRKLIDERAESGSESLMRLMLRVLGCSFDVQVRVKGVGRVDFVVDGWLIIECDSEAHHGGWENRRRDLRRDQAAAARGFCTFRPIAEDILWNPDDVRAALTGLVRSRRRAELRTDRHMRV